MSERSAPTRDEGGCQVAVGGINVSEEHGGDEVRLGVVAGEGLVQAVDDGDDAVIHAKRVVQTAVESVALIGDGDGRSARVRGEVKTHV